MVGLQLPTTHAYDLVRYAAAEIAREYQRVGYKEGELWPAPPEDLKPAEIIALFKRIPDGAGRDGYFAELAKIAKQ